jgi:hypothetical protein
MKSRLVETVMSKALLSNRWKIFMAKFSRREYQEFVKFDNKNMVGIL